MVLIALLLSLLTAAESPVEDAALAELRTRLPAAGRVVAPTKAADWRIEMGRDIATTALIQSPGVPGGEARRVAVTAAGEKAWDVMAKVTLTEPVEKGDVMLLAFLARAESADNEAQSGILPSNHIEVSNDPWTSAGGSAVLVGGDWTWVYASGRSPIDAEANSAVISIHLASAPQVLDLGPVYVLNFGPDADPNEMPQNRLHYGGREPNAPWRVEAAARIEQHRKGDLTITVVDADGTPIEGATIEVAMQRHAFGFGAFIGHTFTEGGEDQERLRASFHENFNYATLPVYWQDWGWYSDKRRAEYISQLRYFSERGIPYRTHTVIYPAIEQTPAQFQHLEGEALRDAVLAHTKQVFETMKPFAPSAVDVINELRTGDDLSPRYGSEEILVDIFRTAKETDSQPTLFVNDYGIVNNGGANRGNINAYHALIERLTEAGAPIEGVGFQGHFAGGLTHPARVYEVIDEFTARHGLPIQITEFDIDSRDEQGQADYVRDFATICFSHPNVTAFVHWGWWEGDHWRPDGALVRKDWSEKPAMQAWRTLTQETFWTHEMLTTEANGTATLRGFLGEYNVTVTRDDSIASVTLELKKEGADVTLELD